MMKLPHTFSFVALSAILLTGPTACHRLPAQLPLTPTTLVSNLYTQAVARQPNDIPAGADWQALAPYLSSKLTQSIEQARACAADWQSHDPNPALTARIGGKFGLLFGGPSHIVSFAIQKTELQPNGTIFVYVTLKANPETYLDHARIAAIVTPNHNHPAVDDILNVNDNTWDNEADRPHHLLTEYLAAGCNGPQWIGHTLPNDPAALAQSLYSNVAAHPTSGIPQGEDWKIFAPYLSQSLLQKIDVYDACIADEVSHYASRGGPPAKLVSLDESGIFSGGDEEEAPRTAQVQKTEPQKDGTIHVTVNLGLPQYEVEWPVVDIFTQESDRLVLKDVIFPDEFTHNGVRDPRPSRQDGYLSRELAMTPECNRTHWTGHF